MAASTQTQAAPTKLNLRGRELKLTKIILANNKKGNDLLTKEDIIKLLPKSNGKEMEAGSINTMLSKIRNQMKEANVPTDDDGNYVIANVKFAIKSERGRSAGPGAGLDDLNSFLADESGLEKFLDEEVDGMLEDEVEGEVAGK